MTDDNVESTTLKAVFKVRGKFYDVFLDGEEIVWTLQGALNTGTVLSMQTDWLMYQQKD